MSISPSLYGNLTRKLFQVWNERAELPNKQLVRSLPYIFHDMDVYPSRSQIHEMIHCANDCSRRKNGDYLTFGEFCVYAAELKSSYDNRVPHPIPLSKCKIPQHRRVTICQQKNALKDSSKFEVFLGGSCNPTTWRIDIAIPLLKNLGITYYNPQVAHWGPELIELESSAKQNAEVLFFVIDNQTRSVASMIEVAFISGSQRKLILVVNEYVGPGNFIFGELISDKEYKDLKQGQSYLQDIVERQGIPIFDQVPVALACVARLLREGIGPQELSREDNAIPVRMAHIQLGDKLIKLREVFDSLDFNNKGEITLTDLRLAFRVITGEELSVDNLREIANGQIGGHFDDKSQFTTINLDDIRINFDEFCCIVTEFKSQINSNDKFGDILAKKLSTFFLQPLSRVVEWLFKPVTGVSKLNNEQIPYNAHYRDIYLGGSAFPSLWREEIAIPLLKKHGLTYFSSQSDNWTGDRMIPLEAAAIEKSRVLLFTITKNTRALSSMILAAHYVSLGCNVVLCIQHLEDDCIIEDEKLTKLAIKDYNRGRVYLSDLATRAGMPVFENISEAVMCCVKKCIYNNNLTLDKECNEKLLSAQI